MLLEFLSRNTFTQLSSRCIGRKIIEKCWLNLDSNSCLILIILQEDNKDEENMDEIETIEEVGFINSWSNWV